MFTKIKFLILFANASAFAGISDTTLVHELSKIIPREIAETVLIILTPAALVAWRLLAEWATRKKTTWYWNPVTKKFVISRIDKILSILFSKGVVKSSIQYENNLPLDAEEEKLRYALKKYQISEDLKKRYPLLNVPVTAEEQKNTQ